MRSIPWITFWVGLLIGVGYVLGSLVLWRSTASAALTRDQSTGKGDGRIDPGAWSVALEAVVVVAWSTAVLWITDWAAPGSASFRDASAIGFLSSQALTAWESAALWAGLATLVGFMFPATSVRNGRLGVAGAAALVLWHLPITFFVLSSVFFAAQMVRGRPERSLTIALLALPPVEWVASILELGAPWGLVHGPETALWVTILAGTLAARRLIDPPPLTS